jgi:hypothetical protein
MWNSPGNQQGHGRWAWWGSIIGAGLFAWSALGSGAGFLEILLYAAIGAMVGMLVGGALSGAVEGFSQSASLDGRQRRAEVPEQQRQRVVNGPAVQQHAELRTPLPGEMFFQNGEVRHASLPDGASVPLQVTPVAQPPAQGAPVLPVGRG